MLSLASCFIISHGRSFHESTRSVTVNKNFLFLFDSFTLFPNLIYLLRLIGPRYTCNLRYCSWRNWIVSMPCRSDRLLLCWSLQARCKMPEPPVICRGKLWQIRCRFRHLCKFISGLFKKLFHFVDRKKQFLTGDIKFWQIRFWFWQIRY